MKNDSNKTSHQNKQIVLEEEEEIIINIHFNCKDEHRLGQRAVDYL